MISLDCEEAAAGESTEDSSTLQTYRAIAKALQQGGGIFTPITGLDAAAAQSSMPRVMKSKAVKSLRAMMTEHARLAAEIGFNQGTQEISVTLKLPECSLTPSDDVRQLIVWTALGIMADQEMLEAAHARETPGGGLLANLCLECWGRGSELGLVSKEVHLELRSMKLVFEQMSKGLTRTADGHLFTDKKNEPLSYSPIYNVMSGYCVDGGAFGAATLTARKQQLMELMLQDFWARVDSCRYIPDAQLRVDMSKHLDDYLSSGIRGQTRLFRPNTNTTLFYLHGAAGIGKSSFVQAFSTALEHVLNRYVNPELRVDIIKVPLNAITAGNLQRVLHVKGISDWSIERILEQTICKGNVALFHLEEAPSDPDEQSRLFTLIQNMLERLTRRYREWASNIFHLMTSNYEPATSISQVAAVVQMKPPTREQQLDWLARGLSEVLQVNTEREVIEVVLDWEPAHTQDMRPLKKCLSTLGFHIAQHICRAQGSQATRGGLCVRLTGETDCVTAHLSSIDSEEEELKPQNLTLHSADGFFFEQLEDAAAYTVGGYCSQRLATIAIMVECGYLTPGLLLLTGQHSDRQLQLLALREWLHERYQDRLVQAEVTATEDADKALIVGHPHEINGGLLRILNDTHTPTTYYGTDETVTAKQDPPPILLIVAHVNQIGQFLMRELVEEGDSRTHTRAVSMSRVLFVLDIEDGSQISSPILSRAHDIIEC